MFNKDPSPTKWTYHYFESKSRWEAGPREGSELVMSQNVDIKNSLRSIQYKIQGFLEVVGMARGNQRKEEMEETKEETTEWRGERTKQRTLSPNLLSRVRFSPESHPRPSSGRKRSGRLDTQETRVRTGTDRGRSGLWVGPCVTIGDRIWGPSPQFTRWE